MILMAGSVLASVSCGGPGRKAKDTVTETAKAGTEIPAVAETADVTYHVLGTDDNLSLFEMTAVYTAPSGETVREAVTALPWDKTVAGVKLPFTAGVDVELVPKTDFPKKDLYKVGLAITDITYRTSKGNGIDYINKPTQSLNVKSADVGKFQESEMKRQAEKHTSKELVINATR